jgi:hypothetical protein
MRSVSHFDAQLAVESLSVAVEASHSTTVYVFMAVCDQIQVCWVVICMYVDTIDSKKYAASISRSEWKGEDANRLYRLSRK